MWVLLQRNALLWVNSNKYEFKFRSIYIYNNIYTHIDKPPVFNPKKFHPLMWT